MGLLFNNTSGNARSGLQKYFPNHHGLDPDGNVITAVINIVGTGAGLIVNGAGSVLKLVADGAQGLVNSVSPITNIIPLHSVGDKIVQTLIDNVNEVGDHLGSHYVNKYPPVPDGDRSVIQALGDVVVTAGEIVVNGVGSILQFGADVGNGLLNQGGPVGALLPNFLHSPGDYVLNLGVTGLQKAGDFLGGNYEAKYQNHFDAEWDGKITLGPKEDSFMSDFDSRGHEHAVDSANDNDYSDLVSSNSVSQLLHSGSAATQVNVVANNNMPLDGFNLPTPASDDIWAQQVHFAVV